MKWRLFIHTASILAIVAGTGATIAGQTANVELFVTAENPHSEPL